MKGKSVDIAQDKLGKLKKLFPEIFSEGKVDPEKLRLTIGEDLNIQNERYVLNWAGKSDAFRVLQTPTTATLAPTSEGIGDINKTGNVFIEGENLEVLKILQKSYYGKIKMIYIDPPYNTGNDNFIYPDRFYETKEEYLKRIGEKDEEGYLLKEGIFRKNSKENGQFHSNWLSMMYPRLFLARNLLKDDGVIFVSIDDNEVHNLRLLMNEVFGEENFVTQLVWENKEGGGSSDSSYFRIKHEYILCYGKNIENLILNGEFKEEDESYNNEDEFIKDRGKYKLIKLNSFSIQYSKSLDYEIRLPNGQLINPSENEKRGCWRWSKQKYEWGVENKFIEFKENEDGKLWVYTKQYFKVDNDNKPIVRSVPYRAVIPEYSSTQATKQMEHLLGKKLFDYSKPYGLIKFLISLAKKNGGNIILDFFAGSGTTAQAVLDLNKEDGGNRKFILVQLPEQCKEDSEAFKAGYKTIADICKERIRRVIKKIAKEKKDNPDLFAHTKTKEIASSQAPRNDNTPDLGFKVFKLKNSNFKIWRSDVIKNGKDLENQMDAFEKPVKPEAKITNMVWEIMLKSGYDLNTKVEEKKVNGCEVYSAAEGDRFAPLTASIIIALSKISQSAIKDIIKLKPKRCICLDSLFAGNDQLKTNTVLQMKDAGIEFKTI